MQINKIRNVRMAFLGTLSEKEIEDIEKYFKYLRAVPKLGNNMAKKLEELQFAEVQNIKDGIDTDNGLLEAMSVVYSYPVATLMNFRIVEFYQARNHLSNQLENLLEREKMLHVEPNEELVSAGVEKLSQFGVLNTLDRLALRYHTTIQNVEKWRYDLVFALVLKANVEDEISERMTPEPKKH